MPKKKEDEPQPERPSPQRSGATEMKKKEKRNMYVDSLIESLVLHSALPKVFARFWRGRKVRQDDLFILHVKNKTTCRKI